MRILALAVAFSLLLVPLVGCIGSDDSPEGDESASELDVNAIEQNDVEVPEDAQLQEIEDGYRLAWDEVQTPFQQEVTIPQNTVGVTAKAQVDAEAPVWVNITRVETGVERCSSRVMNSYDQPVQGLTSCSSLASVDDLPATWSVSVESKAEVAQEVHVDYEAFSPDGLVDELNLSELPAAEHDVLDPESLRVESHDGTSLHVEVTRPDVEAPVPVILIPDVPDTGDAEQAAALADAFDPETYTQELAARGYAVVQTDVRGTGQSGGCLDLWGQAERADQHVLVEWAAEQEWSVEKVAAFGLGYSATTALTGAVEAPEALETVVAFGVVTNPYDSWHFGGVPNGDGFATSGQTQALGALGYASAAEDIQRFTRTGDCDAGQYSELLDPRAVYGAFYEVRDLPQQADAIEVPMLYGQGLNDATAKGSMALNMVQETQDQTLAMIGPWANQLPDRADTHLLMQAWLADHLTEAEVGAEALVGTSSVTQPEIGAQATIATATRTADVWPPQQPDVTSLFPNFDESTLSNEPVEGEATVVLDPVGATVEAGSDDNTLIRLEGTIEEDILITGGPTMQLVAEAQGVENAFLATNIYVEEDGERELLTMGMANLAHHEGHDTYSPLVPGQLTEMVMPLEPVEQVLPAGATLEIEIRSTTTTDWTLVQPGRAGALVLQGGADGMVLELPTTPVDQIEEVPRTVAP